MPLTFLVGGLHDGRTGNRVIVRRGVTHAATAIFKGVVHGFRWQKTTLIKKGCPQIWFPTDGEVRNTLLATTH
jgi:hypothetical protein